MRILKQRLPDVPARALIVKRGRTRHHERRFGRAPSQEASSVVISDVPPFSLAMGNPAEVYFKRNPVQRPPR